MCVVCCMLNILLLNDFDFCEIRNPLTELLYPVINDFQSRLGFVAMSVFHSLRSQGVCIHSIFRDLLYVYTCCLVGLGQARDHH